MHCMCVQQPTVHAANYYFLSTFVYIYVNMQEHLQWPNVWCGRDFDGFDLWKRLPAVVSKLDKAINQNGGVTYIHCTAGLGRAPAVAVCMSVSFLKCDFILTGHSYFSSNLSSSGTIIVDVKECLWCLILNTRHHIHEELPILSLKLYRSMIDYSFLSFWTFCFEFQLAYMFWVQGYRLGEAHKLLLVNTYLFILKLLCIFLLANVYNVKNTANIHLRSFNYGLP